MVEVFICTSFFIGAIVILLVVWELFTFSFRKACECWMRFHDDTFDSMNRELRRCKERIKSMERLEEERIRKIATLEDISNKKGCDK